MRPCLMILASILLLQGTSCVTNGYTKFYHPYVDPTTQPDLQLLASDQQPKIFTTNKPDVDIPDVLSNHYVIIGNSSFVGPLNSEDGIKEVCKKNHASVVLVFKKYESTSTTSGNIVIPSTSTTNVFGTVSSDSGSGFYSGTATTTGTTVIPYSNTIQRYEQTAYYFVKITRKFKVGIVWANLNSETQQRVQRNTGVIVQVVYKETPAYKANIIRGDIVIKLNDNEVEDSKQLTDIVNAIPSGSTVKFLLIRNNQQKEISFVVE